MLRFDDVLRRDGIAIHDVACGHHRGAGHPDEYAGAPALVFVRRGCFVYASDGVERLMDPTVAYFMRSGAEVRYDHPHAGGDDCTYVELAPELVASLWGGEEGLPVRAVRTSGALDAEHRLLLAAARRPEDPHDIVERAIALTAHTLEIADAGRVGAGAPATAGARRHVVDGAREVLAADPGRSLPQLARDLATSPHHLSRLFSAANGHTISRHRMRLRVRAALERLAAGEDNLARLSADLGFADQSHLCRVVRDETGATPSALRAALARPDMA